MRVKKITPINLVVGIKPSQIGWLSRKSKAEKSERKSRSQMWPVRLIKELDHKKKGRGSGPEPVWGAFLRQPTLQYFHQVLKSVQGRTHSLHHPLLATVSAGSLKIMPKRFKKKKRTRSSGYVVNNANRSIS